MLVDGLLVLLGFALLLAGGEALVRGASGIALLARVTPAVIGLTIVAAGTSMPELLVSVQSALQGSPGLAVGNVVGSNIFNVGAIVGITAMLRPLTIRSDAVRMEWPVMMLAAAQLHLLGRDGQIDRLEGGFLAGALVAFIAYVARLGRREAAAGDAPPAGMSIETASGGRTGPVAVALDVGGVLAGGALLALGSTALVSGASDLAAGFGVSEAIVGLTIVAAGTSTPELVTSLVAVRRGQDDLAVGNVVGSNIFNVLGIMGVTALVQPVDVPAEVIARDDWWMLGLSALLFPLMWTGMRVTRAEGAVLFGVFCAYMAMLVAAVRA